MNGHFNEEYARRTPKDKWIKEFEGLKENFDLEKEWESAQVKPEDENKTTEQDER